MASQADGFAFHDDLRAFQPADRLPHQQRVQQKERHLRHLAGTQVLPGDPRRQRVLAMKRAHGVHQPGARRAEPGGIDVPGIGHGDQGCARCRRGDAGFPPSGARHQFLHADTELRFPHQ